MYYNVIHMNETIQTIYEENYYPNFEKLYKLVKKQDDTISKKDVKEFLNDQIENQLLKDQKIKRSETGHIVAYAENDIWQIDIFVLSKYAQPKNKGYEYIFVAIDVFTRKAYAVAMKTKTGTECAESLKQIIDTSKKAPVTIMSDNDKAFLSSAFTEELDKYDIILDVNILNDHHALGIIDNFAKRIKTTLSKTFLRTKTTIWINSLDKIVELYNNSEHSSLEGLTPNEASDPTNTEAILDININKNQKNKTVSDIKPDDKVRIRISGSFKKGTEPKWSDAVYSVVKVSGATIRLDNETRHKRNDLLQVPENSESSGVNVIVKRNNNNKIKRNAV